MQTENAEVATLSDPSQGAKTFYSLKVLIAFEKVSTWIPLQGAYGYVIYSTESFSIYMQNASQPGLEIG